MFTEELAGLQAVAYSKTNISMSVSHTRIHAYMHVVESQLTMKTTQLV